MPSPTDKGTAALAAGRRAWPGVEVPEDVFARYLADHVGTHVVDLYLACGCARGDGAAIAAFEARVLPEVDRAVRRLARDADFASEVRQRVRTHLLVGPPPRIADYQGHGPLVAWTRIVASRVALQLMRGQRAAERRTEALAAEPAEPYVDLERELIKDRYRTPFRKAFGEAMSALSPHERNLLQLHLIEGLSLSQIGALHAVNKSTVSRWLAHARTTLDDELRSRLQAELHLADGELDSLLGVLHSRMDLSVERMLGDRDAGEQ